MNLRDFISGNEDNARLVWQYAINNGIQFQSMDKPWQPSKQGSNTTLNGYLSKATDDEIAELASALNIEFDANETATTPQRVVQSIPADLYADEQRDTVPTKSGENVEVLMLPYAGRTSRRGKKNVKVSMKNGNTVILDPHDTLLALNLAIGDLIPVRPDSIIFTKQEGYFYGKVNFSHSLFTQINADIEEFADAMESWEIKMRKVYGMSSQEIKEVRKDKATSNNPLPTIKSVYFK